MLITTATLMLLHATEPSLTPEDLNLASRLELAVRHQQLAQQRPNLVLPVVLCVVGSALFSSGVFYVLGENHRDDLFKRGSPLGEVLLIMSGAGAVMMGAGSVGLWSGWQERKRANAEMRLIEDELVRRTSLEALDAGLDVAQVERETRAHLAVSGEYSVLAALGGAWLTILSFGMTVLPLGLSAISRPFSTSHEDDTIKLTKVTIVSTIGAIGALTIPLAAWVFHRDAGGQGSVLGAYLGFVAGALAAGALIAATVPFAQMDSDGPTSEEALIVKYCGLVGLPALAAGALIAGPIVGLHVSHTRQLPSFSIAPTNGGAAVSLGWRF